MVLPELGRNHSSLSKCDCGVFRGHFCLLSFVLKQRKGPHSKEDMQSVSTMDAVYLSTLLINRRGNPMSVADTRRS